MAAWVRNGIPEGPRIAFSSTQASASEDFPGTPDLVLSPEQPFELGPSGDDIFRTYVLPTSLAEDTMAVAIQIVPDNRSIVEQAFLTVQRTPMANSKVQDAPEFDGDRGAGFAAAMGPPAASPNWLIGWVPGRRMLRLPAETGYLLPKNAKLLLTIHYRRTGRVEKDRSHVKIRFGRGIAKQLQGQLLEGPIHTIYPGDSHYRIIASARVAQDSVLYAILPHMHQLGHHIKVSLRPPSGLPRVLLPSTIGIFIGRRITCWRPRSP